MLRYLSITLGVLLCAHAQETPPVKWSIATPPVESAKVRSTIKVRVAAEVPAGWHLYSLKEVEDGPIPTKITVAEGQPFRQAGDIEAPGPLIAHDPNFDKDLEYYEGEVEFVVPVEITMAAAPGRQTLTITARYQTCNDKLCLPPKTVKLELPVTVLP